MEIPFTIHNLAGGRMVSAGWCNDSHCGTLLYCQYDTNILESQLYLEYLDRWNFHISR